jgi:hypothetical protein
MQTAPQKLKQTELKEIIHQQISDKQLFYLLKLSPTMALVKAKRSEINRSDIRDKTIRHQG